MILADTKFEFGFIEGEITLIDELLTPDSSRFLGCQRLVSRQFTPRIRQAIPTQLANPGRLEQRASGPCPAGPCDPGNGKSLQRSIQTTYGSR